MNKTRQSHPDHVKARSRRGWTEPTPKEQKERALVAQAQAATVRKAMEKQAQQAQHEEWLYNQAKKLPEIDQFNWLTQNTNPSTTAKIMSRLAAP